MFDSSNLSAKVTADTAQGIYIAPASAPTGASGAWVRKFDGPINPLWFGVVEGSVAGANGAANDIARAAMDATLRARSANAITNYQGIEAVRFPLGYYEFATTWDITDGTRVIEGVDTGFPAGRGTILKFPTGVTGIRTQRYNTSGATTTDGVTHRGGDGLILRNIALIGAYTSTEAEAHGIHLRSRAQIENVFIDLFEGDGIFTTATAGGGANEGNANNCVIIGGRVQRCRRGVFVDGADGNIWLILGLDVSSNRQWGIDDSSFLGNTYVGCHAATNGIVTGTTVTVVSHGGNRYGVIAGQEVGASTNAPSGTTADNTWWYYIGAGGVSAGNNILAWTNGTTYRAGGSFKTDNANARNLFDGCYHEGGQGNAQFVSPTVVVGGILAGSVYGDVTQVAGNFLRSPALNSENILGQTRIKKESSGAAILQVHNSQTLASSVDSAVSFAQGLNANGTPCDLAEVAGRSNGADPATCQGLLIFATRASGGTMTDRAQLDGANTTLQPASDNGLSLGQAARRWTNAHVTTFTGYGAITTNAAGQGVGYRTGAGGAITQLTSKSTGVTLSRPCGQITMNNAALAAGASVSFTFTNSLIAATDVVIVNIGSGASADSYEVKVTAVAAGSCRIQVRNISGGSLSEALVLNFAVLKSVTS